jgi:hypothetical protein
MGHTRAKQDPAPGQHGEDVVVEWMPPAMRAVLEDEWEKATGPMAQVCKPLNDRIQRNMRVLRQAVSSQQALEQMQKISDVCKPLLSSAQEFKDVTQRMAPWQKKAWRHLTLREIKRRLDAEVAVRGAPERRPVDRSEARPREHRSRAHARRGPPSDDDGPEPPASAFQRAHRSLLPLTRTELRAYIDIAQRRLTLLEVAA